MGSVFLSYDFSVYIFVIALTYWILLQEVFYLTYTPEDVEGNITLDTGDKVSFYMETNKQ